MAIDFRAAMNALSDVVQNRPVPLREFDQIYMKVGDMLVHAEWLARKFRDRRVVFVGDGDAVGLAMMHLKHEGVIDYGPKHVTVLDFDERMVNSVNHFAEDYELQDQLDARLYNVIDALPADVVDAFDAFHVNPPWGQYNAGDSIAVFLERAICATRVRGLGAIIVAHDPERAWAAAVLKRTQESILGYGCVVDEMLPGFHSYHLDDAPDLRSCTIVVQKSADGFARNDGLAADRLRNFYGREQPLCVHYVRERGVVAPGKAPPDTYSFDLLPARPDTE
jgi:predicted methyltransferase